MPRFLLLFLVALLLAGGACGDDDATVGAGNGTATTQPDESTTTQPDGDVFPVEEARGEAREILGAAEDDLDDDVRVARRGDETFALTEDYVLGRLTVELDEDDAGGYRVVSVTVELPDGPEVFELGDS